MNTTGQSKTSTLYHRDPQESKIFCGLNFEQSSQILKKYAFDIQLSFNL